MFFHLLGLAGEIFVVVDPPPGCQPFAAGGNPVYLFLLSLVAQSIADVSFCQRLTCRATGQIKGMESAIA